MRRARWWMGIVLVAVLAGILPPAAATAWAGGPVPAATTTTPASAAAGVAADVEQPRQRLSAGDRHTCAVRSDRTVTCWGEDGAEQSMPPAGTFEEVAAGYEHSCGVRTDGTLACWGGADAAVRTPPGGTFTSVSAGGSQACGVRSDGTVTCWGQAGTVATPAPGGAFAQVAAGDAHACGVRPDASLVCWGDDSNGQADAPSGSFTQVSAGTWHSCGVRVDGTVACWGSAGATWAAAPAGSFSSVSAGRNHTCGLHLDGTVSCWGRQEEGQLDAPAGTFTAVVAGGFHTCGAREDATVTCWGRSQFGEADPPTAGTVQLAVGNRHVCALRAGGSVACWGDDGSGQASPPDAPFASVAAGVHHTCGVRAAGTVACWGSNGNGRATPPAGQFTAVDAGDGHSCGLRTDASVVCWGADHAGQATAPAGTFSQVSTGWDHTCALRTNGTVACWGSDGSGRATPPAGTFTQVAAGPDHSCGVRTAGSVMCWGGDIGGQASPPAGTFVHVAVGPGGSCGVRSDATMACWGSTSYGRADVPPGAYTSAHVGESHSCGLRTDGTPNCWGRRLVAIGPALVLAADDAPPTSTWRSWPTTIGATGEVSLRIIGPGLPTGATVALARPGGPRVVAGTVFPPDDGVLEARFDLPGIALGTWDVEVGAPGAAPTVLPGAVTVEPPNGYRLAVSIAARSAVRVGVPAGVTLTVHNSGNVDGRVVPVYLDGLPAGTQVEGRFDEVPMPAELVPGLAADGYDLATVPPAMEDDGGLTAMAPLVLSRVPAGSSVDVPLRITVPDGTGPFQVRAWATACMADLGVQQQGRRAPAPGPRSSVPRELKQFDPEQGGSTSSDACLFSVFEALASTALDLVPGARCAKTGFQQFAGETVAGYALVGAFGAVETAATGSGSWGSRIGWAVASTAMDCFLDFFPPAKAVRVAKALWTFGKAVVSGYGAAGACVPTTPPVHHQFDSVQSADPNEKVGPAGAGGAGFTTPDVPFRYTVFFENQPSATAAAQRVVVTDPIDTVGFDPDTIQLGPVTVSGEVVATPPPGAREWTTVVPVAGMDDLLGVDVSWDEPTGTLEWVLTTVDPTTMEPTEDPLAGFLPPNVTAPEGEGSVAFSIEPRERTDGTVLANAASIVFDANAPIVTDTWVNTLDGTAPTSQVAALPEEVDDEAIEVSWSGSDAAGGLAGWELWVAVDGGHPVVWFTTEDVGLTSATFTGEPGRRYEFWTVAWDHAGNKERFPLHADAATLVRPAPCRPGAPGPFVDVGATHEFCGAIHWMAEPGYSTGYPDGTFRPTLPASRQALAAFLHRMAGSPEAPGGPQRFRDVGPESPFYAAIQWMASEGHSTGYADGTFRPGEPLSRQALAAFLHRMAGAPAVPPGAAPFADVPAGHPFAEPVRWMARTGVSTGYADGTFRPTALVSRQALATFLHRFTVLGLG